MNEIKIINRYPEITSCCPVCNGTGIVSRPPWIAGDVTEWCSGGTQYACKACQGKGVINGTGGVK